MTKIQTAALAASALVGLVLLRSRPPEPTPPTPPQSGTPPELDALQRRSLAMLETLRSEIRPLIVALIRAAYESGISLVVTDAFRSSAEQDRIYEQGRTTPGPIVTEVRGGSSWHNYGLAADLAVLAGGQPTWPNDLDLWARIGAIGKRAGLRWGGDFPTPDRPHFEFHPPGIGPGISPPPIA